mmetsp:Transcript_23572/g.56358  ORF Transcript_23572/g.56358 Transcript_23572/m.56358 type:complete len:287 (+) Transcript_23572:84-944(+)
MSEIRTIDIKWDKQNFSLPLESELTVGDLKNAISEKTSVPAKRQKLLGLKVKGKLIVSEDVRLGDLELKPGRKVILMGTPDEALSEVERQAQAAPEVQDGFDIEEADQQTLQLKDREEVKEKLARRIKSVQVDVMNEPRPGKKCLVLDIDYTLFDLGSAAERAEELARPYLHEFLSATYQHYDLIIWSDAPDPWNPPPFPTFPVPMADIPSPLSRLSPWLIPGGSCRLRDGAEPLSRQPRQVRHVHEVGQGQDEGARGPVPPRVPDHLHARPRRDGDGAHGEVRRV